MKKIILLFMISLLSLNNINANEVKTLKTIYKQTHVLKTIFPNMVNHHSGWIKQDTIKINLDFMENNKIVIQDEYFNTEYKIIKIDSTKYPNCDFYKMKGIDSKNNKYIIEVLYYSDNTVVFTIVNDYNVVRYKFLI